MKSEDSVIRRAFNITLEKNTFFAVLVVVTVLAGAAINVWPSLILKQIVDESIPEGGIDLWRIALVYLVATLFIGLVDLVREYCATVFGQRMLLNIRDLMLERLRALPMFYYNNTPAGETLSRFTADIDAIDSLFSAGLVSAFTDLFKIGGILVAIFYLSAWLGYVALASLPVLYLVTDYFRRNMYEKQLAVRGKVSDINTSIHEIYSGMKIIKIFGMERYFAERFEPTLENHRLAMNQNSVYDAWFPCVTQTIRAVFIATALSLGATENLTPYALGFTLGGLAATADLFIRLFSPIEALAGEIQTIQRALAGVSRVESFFSNVTRSNGVEEYESKKPNSDADVIVDDVWFAYNDGVDVLRGASMVIPAGAKAAIAGRTGSGKTTLMNLVAGLYPSDRGEIRVGGVKPFNLRPEERRRLIGIVPQTVHVFYANILDNITLRDPAISEEQVVRALDTVGLRETVMSLPNGLGTYLGEGAHQLSFGQTQLLSLARAIVTDPPLLLLDELTSGLDSVTERTVLDAIKEVSGKRTILTISHRLSGIIDAEAVHIMDAGRIMESGSPSELEEREGWYSIYKRLEDRGWQIT
jgi:ATP-binding cassette subfamily B protein